MIYVADKIMCIWKESRVRMRALMGMKIKGDSECEYSKIQNICKCIYNEYASVKINTKIQRSN